MANEATSAAEQRKFGQVWSAAAKRGTLREYETVMILRPELNRNDIAALIARLQKVFSERSATLIKIDSWGMRILAYPIKHCRKGVYLYWRYLGGSDVVAEFERHLRIADPVIRFYTIKIDEDVVPDARPSEVTDELLEAVSDPGPDPDLVRASQPEPRSEEEPSDEEAETGEEEGGV